MSIQCEICHQWFNTITNSHVKTHGISISEYIKQFPDSPIVSPEVSAKLADRTRAANKKRDYSNLGEKISATKRAKFESGESKAWNKGVPLSDEQKLKLSISRIGKATRTGVVLSNETKTKISTSLKKKSQTLERIAAHEEKRLLVEKLDADNKLARFQQFANNIKQNKLELLDINYKNHTVKIRCLVCGLEFERSKQAVELSKCAKTVCRECNPPATTSKGQLEILEFIKSLGLSPKSEDREILNGKEIDILIPEKSLGIEFNGLYWHSELNYGEPNHLLWKQQFAYNQGVRLIHIFEDEWYDKSEIVKSRLRHLMGVQTTKIFARQCEIRDISSSEKNSFLEQNHLQGKDISKICYGLFFKGELVSVMTFKPGSFVKGYRGGWELNRFASKLNTVVVGGASKLFKKFLREQNPDNVISFADRRWNTGQLYEQLGFKFSHCSKPSYWYLERYSKRYHRGKFMKHTLIREDSDHKKTEWELMQGRGYDRIWDCGTVVYNYHKL